IGEALLGKKKGDIVSLMIQGHDVSYRILKIH
ncbi:MAG: hypothetical protein UV42_C0040G0001, partial [Candidatus Magasanikbacteria bacterium GW2011_GWE2_42_7]